MTAGYTNVIHPFSNPATMVVPAIRHSDFLRYCSASYFTTRRGHPTAVNLWSVPQGLRAGAPPRARSTT